MVNIGGQQVLQQPQYVTLNQPEMAAAAIGKRLYMKIQKQLVLNLWEFRLQNWKSLIDLFFSSVPETFDIQPIPKPPVKPFDPTDHDLDPNFRLTSFADLKGWGCKLPQDVLTKLLEGIKEETGGQNQFMQSHTPKIGIYNEQVSIEIFELK